MVQPMPAELAAFNEIIDDLNELTTRNPSEFLLHRKLKELEDRANALTKTDLAYGFSALGSIAAARQDIQAMHKNHRKSLQYGSNLVFQRNYAISIWKCGQPEAAVTYAMELFEKNPTDVLLVDHLAWISFELGDEKAYLRFASLYRDLTKQDHESWSAYQEERTEIQRLSRQCAGATACACARADR
ncbi:MAG: hypothetical protein AB7D57_02190 [Desulfovibrionaceae bacterium]